MTFLTIFYLFSFTLAQIPNVGDGKCYLKNREQKPQGETGICLEAHNKARARKGLRPLKWDNNLASQAQAWSSRLAANGGRLSHSNGGGENLYAGGGDCKAAVELWMTEERNYRGQAIGGSDLSLIGHFTQVMWKSTESVGCGRVGGVVTCRYYPAGNMVGETPY